MLDLRAMIRGITIFQTEICQQCLLAFLHHKMITGITQTCRHFS
jgi:hypothetical protein